MENPCAQQPLSGQMRVTANPYLANKTRDDSIQFPISASGETNSAQNATLKRAPESVGRNRAFPYLPRYFKSLAWPGDSKRHIVINGFCTRIRSAHLRKKRQTQNKKQRVGKKRPIIKPLSLGPAISVLWRIAFSEYLNDDYSFLSAVRVLLGFLSLCQFRFLGTSGDKQFCIG